MGRRALRKIDPNLDLSRHLRTVDDLTVPLAQESLFPSPAPLEVELGSGKGLFLHDASGENPHHNFIGVEIARKFAEFGAARLARSERPNALMFQGDGLKLFREFIGDETVCAVHVYFPDPWWKKRHRRRRVMNEAFLADAWRVLQPGGRLHFWTDVQEYFETTLELIARATRFTGPFDVPEKAATHDLDYRTHFERRMRLHNEVVYRAEFARVV